MSKIITTEEPDIELDPESMTDNLDMFEALSKNKTKMLEAIRDLDDIIENGTNSTISDTAIADISKKEKSLNCFIRLESKFTNSAFNMNFNLVGLNQNIVERSTTEVELQADEKKLVKLFSFYQTNIYKEKMNYKIRNQFKVLLSSRLTKRKKKLITKNDVYLTKLYANIDGKKFNLINCVNQIWRIHEMKYAFENNRSTIKVLFVRNK